MKTIRKSASAPKKIKYVIPSVDDCILVIKVGSDERPASAEDLASINEALEKVCKLIRVGEDVTLVTHHSIEFVAVPRAMLLNGSVVQKS